jgi:uncharacterized protein YfaS (alpha-2-macroglobulin family)
LERAQGQITREGYTVAVDELRGSKTLRHLVRFGQKGDFVLPRARLWRMYQPEGKAMEAGPVLRHWVVE